MPSSQTLRLTKLSQGLFSSWLSIRLPFLWQRQGRLQVLPALWPAKQTYNALIGIQQWYIWTNMCINVWIYIVTDSLFVSLQVFKCLTADPRAGEASCEFAQLGDLGSNLGGQADISCAGSLVCLVRAWWSLSRDSSNLISPWRWG